MLQLMLQVLLLQIENLTEVVPLYKDASANLLLPSTQFDMYSAENAGLIKFDFLGLKTLTVINNTQKLVKKKIKILILKILVMKIKKFLNYYQVEILLVYFKLKVLV